MPPLPWKRTLAYMLAAVFIALTQGLGQGFVSALTPQIAGQIGATPTEASWLMAAYLIPRASLPILLIKIRTQYGLREFAEASILLYVAVCGLTLFAHDLPSAILTQFLSGVASAPLASLAFMYMLEGLSTPLKVKIGLPLALTFIMLGIPLARVLAPPLMGDGSWQILHVLQLGLALVSLALVFVLPLRPVPHAKVISAGDLISFALIAAGFGGITVAFVQGPILWWDQPWLGWLLALSVASLTGAVLIETHRTAPLLDIRWLVSPAILHLTVAMLWFRLILSDQSAGAPRMFQVLGMGPDQLAPLFTAIVWASIAGGIACVIAIKPTREPQMHLTALALIALGAWMDSQSTVDTRPAQMILSQSMIAFAGALFMPPAMMMGLLQALAKGPNYILSFVIVFLSTQSLGGVVGSGLFGTFINHRQAAHLAALNEQMTAGSPLLVAQIGQRMQALTGAFPDLAARRAAAIGQIAQDMQVQAYVLAYNDAYFATFLMAAAAMAALMLHMLRDRLAGVAPPMPGAPPPPAPAPAPMPSSPPPAAPEPAR